MNFLKALKPSADPLRVLLVDDCPNYLAATSRFLELYSWVQIVGQVSSKDEALLLSSELEPQLILMDIVMPQSSGIDIAREIKSRENPPLIVMVSLHNNAEYKYYASEAGADGYITKTQLEADLPLLLETVQSSGSLPGVVILSPEEESLKSGLVSQALIESEERLKIALEAGGMGIFDWDLTNDVVTWSQAHAHLCGLQTDRLDGNYASFSSFIHPDDLSSVEEASDKARREHTTYQARYRVTWPGEDSIRWIQAQGRYEYDDYGEALHLRGVATDVTEAMENLQELKQKQARLSAIFDGSPQCINVLDIEGRIQEINAFGQEMLGLESPDLLVGQRLDQFVSPEFKTQAWNSFQSVLKGGSACSEMEIVDGAGQRRWVETNWAPIHCPISGDLSVLCLTTDVTDRKKAEEKVTFLSNYDALTGLPNRALFSDRLQQAMLDVHRHNRSICVIFLDIDGFTNIIDTLGLHVGEVLIKDTANRLEAAVRPGDTVARIGGDEFALLLADMEKEEDVSLIVQRVMQSFKLPFEVDGQDRHTSACLGATLYPLDDNEADVEAMLCNAEIALFRAKEVGRSTCRFYNPEMTKRAHEGMSIETALRTALERDELSLFYQPIVNLSTGKIRGFEALLRWSNPMLGDLSPARFIPIAEDSGMIVPIGEWVLRTACAQMQVWHEAGYSDLYVAVNVSSRQFYEADMVSNIKKILSETGLKSHFLELEITESILITDSERTIHSINQLDMMGIKFSIDDFGTGYSSLSYLKRFPIDTLKIDRSFVRDITTDVDDASIVRAIITMASNLGLEVIAEGVENSEQLAFLTDNGSHSMQGYFFSKPQPVEQISQLLAEGKCLPARQ